MRREKIYKKLDKYIDSSLEKKRYELIFIIFNAYTYIGAINYLADMYDRYVAPYITNENFIEDVFYNFMNVFEDVVPYKKTNLDTKIIDNLMKNTIDTLKNLTPTNFIKYGMYNNVYTVYLWVERLFSRASICAMDIYLVGRLLKEYKDDNQGRNRATNSIVITGNAHVSNYIYALKNAGYEYKL